MSDIFDELCPLCQTPAQFIRIDLQRKHFTCNSCNEFVIFRAAEQQLSKRAVTTLQAFAKNARATANPGLVYVISGPVTGSSPHIDLHAECQPRATALVA